MHKYLLFFFFFERANRFKVLFIQIFGKLKVMFSVTRKCCSPYFTVDGGNLAMITAENILTQMKSAEKHGEKPKMSC